jgi:type IV secretion system protein VirD4
MTAPRNGQSWGPQPQHKHSSRLSRWLQLAWLVGIFCLPRGLGIAAIALTAIAAVVRLSWNIHRWWQRRRPRVRVACDRDPLAAVLEGVAAVGGGAFLGVAGRGRWRTSRPERAVLLLGPPRAGKSSGVIVPAVLSHCGPVVSTSTKPDVLRATRGTRGRLGQTWEFDPTGGAATSGRALRWSPVSCAAAWDGALLMARAMVSGASVGHGTTDATHWSKRAAALLAPLLHAAARGGCDIGDVVDWVSRHDLAEAGTLLESSQATLACRSLTGLRNTEARERSSIFSAAADALEAYTSEAALAAASDPNFDAALFVQSRDTLYIHAAAEDQSLAAPLVCGLLSEIRRATYLAHAGGILPRPVLFALDEAANIAPLQDLPQIASEGGGQGLALLAAFQDLSQARARWGPPAEGFLTLFGDKLILPGVADTGTLESVSVALGEYDRTVTSRTRHPVSSQTHSGGVSTTTSAQRQRVLSPGDVANIPAGRALHLDGLAWELLTLVAAHRDEPWATLTQAGSRAVTSRRLSGR